MTPFEFDFILAQLALEKEVAFKLSVPLNDEERPEITKHLNKAFPNKGFGFWTNQGVLKLHFKRHR